MIQKLRVLNHPEFPEECPSFEISKEQIIDLNSGKLLIVKDLRYKAKYVVKKKDDITLIKTKEDINIESLENMNRNPVRINELLSFFSKYPQYEKTYYMY